MLTPLSSASSSRAKHTPPLGSGRKLLTEAQFPFVSLQADFAGAAAQLTPRGGAEGTALLFSVTLPSRLFPVSVS